MRPATSGPISDLADLPIVLLILDMARLFRRSIGTIRRDCQRDVFRPRPINRRPYQWLKVDVERYLVSLSDQTQNRPVIAARPTRRPRRA